MIIQVIIALPTLVVLLQANLIGAQKPHRDASYPPPDFIQKVQFIHDVCVEKTGVSEESIRKFSDDEVHDDPALKCYMNCQFHQYNIVDDAGEMHYETMKRLIPDSLSSYVKTLVDGCESHVPQGVNQCERAWSWHVCWKEMDPAHYFLL